LLCSRACDSRRLVRAQGQEGLATRGSERDSSEDEGNEATATARERAEARRRKL